MLWGLKEWENTKDISQRLLHICSWFVLQLQLML